MTTDSVSLEVPGSPSFLRLVRLAAADAGTRAGLNIDEIEDLRIGVDELCHALSDGDALRRLSLVFKGDATGVHLTGRCAHDDPVELTEFAAMIVGAVVDECEVGFADGWRTFRIRKSGRA